MADKFLIAPISVGLQNDVRPWLLPDSAFAQLNNAYVYHGRVRKRFSSYLMDQSVDAEYQQFRSRLRIRLGTTDENGDLSGTIPGKNVTFPTGFFSIGQMFSVGNEAFTVTALGSPATVITTGSGTLVFDTALTVGTYAITGGTALTALFFYPAKPVMGIHTYEVADVNDEFTIAFDQYFSYQYVSAGGWEALDFAVANNIWTGSDSQFFWAENYRGIQAYQGYMFVTNFNAADGIRYWDATNWTQMSNASLTYDAAGNYIKTARLIVSFKGRLLLFNTVENVAAADQTFPNRVRYCQVGDPITAVNTPWSEIIGGKGGFIDAPTTEEIISARIMKDRLIVYFERSTFELVYTGNQELPFIWQQVNSELGVESTFSTITFDKSIIGIGQNGIHACNGSYVQRIDDAIQDEVFTIRNLSDGLERVYGIRDFFNQLVYWTMPSASNDDSNYPNKILVYNYENSTWAFFDDSITAFGYYQPPADAQDLPGNFRHVLAGNQQGFMFICDADGDKADTDCVVYRNSPSLQITGINISDLSAVTFTVVNHNLNNGDFVAIENVQGITNLNGNIYQVTVTTLLGVNAFTIDTTGQVDAPAGMYTGLGTIARVSRVDIRTKQYNFYAKNDRDCAVNSINFYIDRQYCVNSSKVVVVDGKITVDFIPDSSTIVAKSMVLDMAPYSTLYPLEAFQQQIWHHVYPEAQGSLIQLRIYLTDAQMVDTTIAWSDFQMHGMMFSAQSTSNRLQ